MDPINQTQQFPSIAYEDIPTPDEHRRDVRRIFRTCIVIGVSMALLAITAVYVAIVFGVRLQTIALVVPIVMGIGIATFAITYAVPVGLVSLKRLEIAYKMGYFGLGQSRETVGAMKAIADRVRRETAPLPVTRRPSKED